jgi:hypothetical protein
MTQAFSILLETEAQGFSVVSDLLLTISGRSFWQQTVEVLTAENCRENKALHRVIQNEPPLFWVQ